MIRITNNLGIPGALLGVVRAEPVGGDTYPKSFERKLVALLSERRKPLGAADEERRKAVRDLLRNGSYRPTGRGKPASEYLLRAASEESPGAFPRIDAPVDACNYISLQHLLPVSIWDLDLAAADAFLFRLGRIDEQYVFNAGGQVIGLHDLITGYKILGGAEAEVPVVTPVKDSLATKTTDATRRVAGCIYASEGILSSEALGEITAAFAGLLRTSEATSVSWAVAAAGETVTV